MSEPQVAIENRRSLPKYPKLLLDGFLIAAAIGWAGMLIATGPDLTDDWSATLFFGLLDFLAAMLGFWAGLGRRRRRFVIVPVAVILLAWGSDYFLGGRELWHFVLYVAGITVVVGLTAGLLRLWKGSLRYTVDAGSERDALQFGIKHIIIWTTVIAAVFAISPPVMEILGGIDFRSDVFVRISGLAACVAIATVVNIWALLGHRVSMLKLLTLVVVGMFTAWGSYTLMHHFRLFAVSTAISQAFTAVAITLVRMQGLRFVTAAAGESRQDDWIS